VSGLVLVDVVQMGQACAGLMRPMGCNEHSGEEMRVACWVHQVIKLFLYLMTEIYDAVLVHGALTLTKEHRHLKKLHC
jgi:hypothetical protein